MKTFIDVRGLNSELKEYLGDTDIVEVGKLVDSLENLFIEYKELEEEFEDYKQEVSDNYEPIPVSRQVDVNERDFI